MLHEFGACWNLLLFECFLPFEEHTFWQLNELILKAILSELPHNSL